jgi:hypothetical protein
VPEVVQTEGHIRMAGESLVLEAESCSRVCSQTGHPLGFEASTSRASCKLKGLGLRIQVHAEHATYIYMVTMVSENIWIVTNNWYYSTT